MRLEEVPDPSPGAGEVLVRLHAAGINPVDTYIRAGRYGDRAFPYTPGLDGAGTIERVGDEVARWKPGDRVYVGGSTTGTYAEKAVCAQNQVHPLPEGISFEQGAGVNVPYATAYAALYLHARARAGETVLIHGASGGVGIAAVQIARAAGMRVIGTGGTEEGRRLVLEQGAHEVLDHHDPEYLAQGMALTGGAGFDVILEMLANVNLGKDLKVVAERGRIVVIGSRGTVEIDPRDAMSRCASIIGMVVLKASPAELAGIHAAIGAGLGSGTLRPVVGQTLPLAEAARGHRKVIESRAFGKIVLTT
jgi:NADPH2:quinone reductase